MDTLDAATPEQRAVHWHGRVGVGMRQTVEAAWFCGQALLDVKSRKKHGRFSPWLETVGIGKRTAQRYMQIFSAYPNASAATHLTGGIEGAIRELTPEPSEFEVKIVTPPTPVEAGERVFVIPTPDEAPEPGQEPTGEVRLTTAERQTC